MNAIRAFQMGLLATCLSLPACASTPEVRSLANRTGAMVQSLSVGTGEFVEAQNRLNEANEAHLERLASNGARDRAMLHQQRTVWTNQGLTSRLSAHDRIQSVAPGDIVGGLAAVHSVSPTQVQNGAASGYTAALAALVDLTTPPSTITVLGELISFGQQVRQTYRELREAAAEQGATTENAAATADNAAIVSAATVPQ